MFLEILLLRHRQQQGLSQTIKAFAVLFAYS